jgi:gamma-glutamylputrescine oxidase
MFSYWEQQSFSRYDHVVIGAGIVGLSVAIELKERHPAARTLVLERGLLPTGATTRNAGFSSTGSVTELLDDLEHMTEAEVAGLFMRRLKGLEKLRRRFNDEQIGYRDDGGYELIREAELEALDRIDYLNELLRPVAGRTVFRRVDEQIEEFGFDPGQTRALIASAAEGTLHSGKLMRALLALAMQLGVELRTGAEVAAFHEEGGAVTVEVHDPFRKTLWPVQAGKLFICTNAFTKKLLPDAEVIPGRGQILVTDPVPGLRFRGAFHFDKGYYYFRDIDGRVLIGGGRNLDFAGETTTEFAVTERIQRELERQLETMILPGIPFRVAHRWAGIMAFGRSGKTPVVQAFSDRVFGAFRMSGMGVALSSHVAEELAILAG